MYFSYHNRLKNLLKTEKYMCVKADGKPFSYIFVFPRLMKTMPIREHRVKEYLKYIGGGKFVHM